MNVANHKKEIVELSDADTAKLFKITSQEVLSKHLIMFIDLVFASTV